MGMQNHEFLINTFIDIAIAPISHEKLQRRLNQMMAQFFYLGVIDFLRQAESLTDQEFYILIAKTFDRYEIPLTMPVQQYLAKATEYIESLPSLENAMYLGAESFKNYWAEKDTAAPLEFSRFLISIDDLNDVYDGMAKNKP